jgi:hypothetical protein
MLLKYEKIYRDKLNCQYEGLIEIYKKIKNGKGLSLKKNDITKAILYRMRSYYITQNKIKDFLNKRYVAAAADFFVESVMFYLKLVLDMKKVNFEVCSERQIAQKKKAIRPDISLWLGDKVVAMIECKTQLGWNRNRWEESFEERDKELKRHFPNAKSYLLVMTSENWGGFSNHKRAGQKYFVLSSAWPPSMLNDDFDSTILNPIEDLFKQITKIKA